MKQKESCLATLRTYVMSNMVEPIQPCNLAWLMDQAKAFDLLEELQMMDSPGWMDIVTLMNKEQEALNLAGPSEGQGARPKAKASQLKASPASGSEAGAKDSEQEMLALSNLRTQHSRGLRAIKVCLVDATLMKEDLSLPGSATKEKIIALASAAEVLQEFDLAGPHVDWQAMLLHIEGQLLTLEQERKHLTVARRKARYHAKAAAPSGVENEQAMYTAAMQVQAMSASGVPREGCLTYLRSAYQWDGTLLGHLSDEVLTDDGWQALQLKLDALLTTARGKGRKRPSSEEPPPVKPGRKKQQPVIEVAAKVGRKKPTLSFISTTKAASPPGCPVLELDEGTQVKLDVLREMRSLAWEDAHLLEGFSASTVTKVQALEDTHNVLGPAAVAVLEGYVENGPKELLMLIKAALDKLEGVKRKKADAFDVMKKGAQELSVPKPKAPKPEPVVSAKEAAAAERARQLEAEKAEKERKAMELQQQREDAKRQREAEKEQRRVEREEERQRREAEKAQKKEEDRKRKEEEKKGPPPKVLDADLVHVRDLPRPQYKLDVDPDLFQALMLAYNFIYLFGEALQITRFPFPLWVQAVTAYNETKIIEEVCRQLVAVCEQDKADRPLRRGGGNWMGDVTALLGETIGLAHDRRSTRGKKQVDSESDSDSDDADQECTVCSKRTQLKKLTRCETCRKFFHIFCLDPPLEEVAEHWSCADCAEERKAEEAVSAAPEDSVEILQLKELCRKAQELGRYNTYQNWGVEERLVWLKHLIRAALETEKIADVIHANPPEVGNLWREYHQQKRDLQLAEAAEIREVTGHKEVEGARTLPGSAVGWWSRQFFLLVHSVLTHFFHS